MVTKQSLTERPLWGGASRACHAVSLGQLPGAHALSCSRKVMPSEEHTR